MKFKNKMFLFIAVVSLNSGFIHAQKQKDRVKEMMENLSKDELIKHLKQHDQGLAYISLLHFLLKVSQ